MRKNVAQPLFFFAPSNKEMNFMKATIQKKLRQIEQEYAIQILYSCESGSRAWGFPSPDSDYDVRFIYKRNIDCYLSIQPGKDHLAFPIHDELDVYGWDISKVLGLICKSNTTPFEWLQSPVIYKDNETFRKELWDLCQHYFCARVHICHYLGVARGAMETMEDREIKIKKLFYVLRPLLAALWCVERDCIPPMNIYPLLELLSGNMREKVLSLIELKSTAAESYRIETEAEVTGWITRTFEYCSGAVQGMEKRSFDKRAADKLFRKIIQT